MNAPAVFPGIVAPFKRHDTVIPRWIADKARKGQRHCVIEWSATVVKCYVDHSSAEPRWFIETLCDGNHPADEWEQVTVTCQEPKEGESGTVFTYSIADK